MIGSPYGDLSLPYLAYLPRRDEGSDRLLVFLHGSGERGLPPERLDEGWSLPACLSEGLELGFPVVSPVCPAAGTWATELIAEFLGALRAHPSARGRSLILCGYSMGATAVFAYLSGENPHADAAVAVAGRIGLFDAARLARFPLLAIYGDGDPRFAEARIPGRMEEIRRAGGRAELVILPGLGHFISREAFTSPVFAAWTSA
jgi:pimeloyl-ACP methyl ester carboxylesterase